MNLIIVNYLKNKMDSNSSSEEYRRIIVTDSTDLEFQDGSFRVLRDSVHKFKELGFNITLITSEDHEYVAVTAIIPKGMTREKIKNLVPDILCEYSVPDDIFIKID